MSETKIFSLNMSLNLKELVDKKTLEDDEKFSRTVSIAVKTLVAGILQHSPIFNRYYDKVSKI